MKHPTLYKLIVVVLLLLLTVSPMAAYAQEDGSAPDAPTAPDGDISPITVEVPEDGFGIEQILLIMSLAANGIVLAFVTFKNTGDPLAAIEKLRDDPKFYETVSRAIDQVPQNTVAQMHELAMLSQKWLDKIEDIAAIAVNATRVDGGQLSELDFELPDGISLQDAREAAMKAIQELAANRGIPIIDSRA